MAISILRGILPSIDREIPKAVSSGFGPELNKGSQTMRTKHGTNEDNKVRYGCSFALIKHLCKYYLDSNKTASKRLQQERLSQIRTDFRNLKSISIFDRQQGAFLKQRHSLHT